MARYKRQERLRETRPLAGFLGAERARLFDGASPERREQLRAAERTRAIYAAWNAVCADTREGRHVTGLHFAPDANELIVYTDGAPWTQELTMLREIIRARMAAKGATVDRLVFRTSHEGYRMKSAAARQAVATPGAHPDGSGPVIDPVPCTPQEEEAIEATIPAIDDESLRKALKSAMKADLALKKGREARK